MDMGNTVKVLVGLAGFASFGLFVAFMCVMIEGSWLAVRWYLGILVFGYGGDIAEWLSAVFSAASAGIRSQFGLDEEAQEALDV